MTARKHTRRFRTERSRPLRRIVLIALTGLLVVIVVGVSSAAAVHPAPDAIPLGRDDRDAAAVHHPLADPRGAVCAVCAVCAVRRRSGMVGRERAGHPGDS